MKEVWLVYAIEECDSYFAEDGTMHGEFQGAFAREADAIGYGVWLLANDKINGWKIQFTRVPIAPPGSMRPPESEFASS